MSSGEPSGSEIVLIVGATSTIARETAAAFADAGYDLILAGRDAEEVRRVAADIAIRHGVLADAERFDALDTDDHERFAEAVTGTIVLLVDHWLALLCVAGLRRATFRLPPGW